MKYQMRFAAKEDEKEVQSWIKEDVDLMDFFPVSTVQETEDLARFWVNYGKKKGAMIALDGDLPVGIAILFLSSYIKLKHHALLQIVVKKKAREKGVGSYLLEKILHLAKKEHGLERVELELYDNPNMSWFTKRGFTP